MISAFALLLGVTGACGGDDDAAGGNGSGDETPAADGPRIVIGSKLDTEAQLLAHMMAATLEAAGYDVSTQIPLGGSDIVR